LAGLSLSGLKKSYNGQQWVLSGIDLTIAEGEFLVLVGPSGCGKSTLLRLIAGLEEPTAGSIFFDDQLINHWPPVQRDIAMVFQDYALYPHMTVEENLGFGLKMRKFPKAEIKKQVLHTAALLKIEPLLKRRPALLSGGQRQRVAIGRAMIRSPQFYLFDEPLSNLDAQLRAQMRIEIAEMHRRSGRTSIYVTHDQQEAMTLADRIVVLDQGKIQQIGSPLELYHQPCNRLVGTFIGSPSMNLFDGVLTASTGIGPTGRLHYFAMKETTLELPPALPIPDFDGPLQIGLRPEDLHLMGSSESSRGSVSEEWRQGYPEEMTLVIQPTVTHVEMHGHEVQLIAKLDNRLLTVRAQNHETMGYFSRCRIGDTIRLGCRGDKIHWFAGDQKGERLKPRSQFN
jgi:multiple sugar transport system ATP-binding protein